MTSTFSDELTLSQKLSTFCLQFGGQLATAKERLKSGEPLDDVLDQLFLLALGDLCRTLNCSDALLNHAALLPNLGDDHHPQQQPNQMWTQMLNCFTSSLNEGDDNGDDDGDEDEYEDDEDQQQLQQQQQQVSADMFSKHIFPMHHHHHQAFLQTIMPFIKQEEPEVQEELPKLFHCEYPNCGKSFRRQTDLKSHFQRHNAVKQFECAWPECTFKSTYSSSVGEHIGKLHFKCQTRGPNRADYLDEAKKWIRKINTSTDEADGAGGADKPGTSAARTSGSPFPTGPFLCCGRNFSNWFNLNKHQNSRKCVSAVLANRSQQQQLQNLPQQNLQSLQTLPQQNHQQKKFQKDLPVDVSFTAAAAAAVAVYSQQSISGATDNFGGFVEKDDDADDGGQPALKKAKVEVEELSSSDDSSDDDSSSSSDSDD